jgi:hypothetical protein
MGGCKCHRSRSASEIEARKVRACKGKFNELEVKNINSESENIKCSNITCAKIDSLNVNSLYLAGKDVTSTLSDFGSYKLPTVLVDITAQPTPKAPKNIDPDVYAASILQAFAEKDAIQLRMKQGRDFIYQYLKDRGCPDSCPPPVPEVPVPLEIYGAVTLPLYYIIDNGVRAKIPDCSCIGITGPVKVTGRAAMNDTMSFNLSCSYYLEGADSIDARTVTVLVRVGYKGPTGIVFETVAVYNKQFYPTIDVEYGENFKGAGITVPANILSRALTASSDPLKQGLIQMVIYKEQGILIRDSKGNQRGARAAGTTNDSSTTVLAAVNASQQKFDGVQSVQINGNNNVVPVTNIVFPIVNDANSTVAQAVDSDGNSPFDF